MIKQSYKPGDTIIVSVPVELGINGGWTTRRTKRNDKWIQKQAIVIKAYPNFVLASYQRGAYQTKECFLYREILG